MRDFDWSECSCNNDNEERIDWPQEGQSWNGGWPSLGTLQNNTPFIMAHTLNDKPHRAVAYRIQPFMYEPESDPEPESEDAETVEEARLQQDVSEWEKMDAGSGRGGSAVREQDSSRHVQLEVQLVQQEKSPKLQVPKDVIRCDECGQSFSELAELSRHKQSEHASHKPQRYGAGGQEFALLSSLQLRKPSTAALSCHLCQRVFPNTTSLTAHLTQQHSAEPESPGQESRPFYYPFNRQDGGPYACAPCGRNFKQKPALLHHQQAGCYTLRDLLRPWPDADTLTVPSLTPQGPTPASLPPAPAPGASTSLLSAYLPPAPAPGASTSLPSACLPPAPARRHVCSLCPRGFRSQAGLACHQRLRHPLEWKTAQSRFWKLGGSKFPCPSCDKVFCHAPSLSQHQARCHKKVKRRTRVKHQPKGPGFPCRSCDMVFSQTSKLHLHRKEQHCRQEGERERRKAGTGGQTKRKASGKAFPDPLSYRTHLKTQGGQQRRIQRSRTAREPDKNEADPVRPYQCPQCEKAYIHRCNLSRHLHVHKTGAQPEPTSAPPGKDGRRRVKCKELQKQEAAGTFPCPSCAAVFSLQSALRSHEEVHQAALRSHEEVHQAALSGHEEELQSAGGVRCCSVCSQDMESGRRTGGAVAGFYHCVPCKRAFRTLRVFLQHCQLHLHPHTAREGATDSSDRHHSSSTPMPSSM